MKMMKPLLVLALAGMLSACGNGREEETPGTADTGMTADPATTTQDMPGATQGSSVPEGETTAPADNTRDNSDGTGGTTQGQVPTGTERTQDRMTDDSVNNRTNMGSSR